MAQITLEDLRKLIAEHTKWKQDGRQPPEKLTEVVFSGKATEGEKVFSPEMAGKTLTFEGRNVTLILDFDEKGYVCGIQFV